MISYPRPHLSLPLTLLIFKFSIFTLYFSRAMMVLTKTKR